LGNLYQQHGEFSLAIESYRRAIQINPNNDTAYTGLGWCYMDQPGGEVVQFFKKAIEINPKNIWALDGLGTAYLEKEEFSEAETVFKKAIEVDPKNERAYIGLTDSFHKQRMTLQTEELFRVVELFKQAIELSPDKDVFYRALARLCDDAGEKNLAKEYYGKANVLSIDYYPPLSANNYRMVKDILDKRGIQLVCVQYPIRNIELLKRMFNEQGSIIFIDNEMIFGKAVRKGGYNKYFLDMFGGDFGHCTVEGNMLLAENIANGILEMFFRENKKIRLK
jgi:tetratricopeptide (TPR) repeat protein